jgi:hypothetical protein
MEERARQRQAARDARLDERKARDEEAAAAKAEAEAQARAEEQRAKRRAKEEATVDAQRKEVEETAKREHALKLRCILQEALQRRSRCAMTRVVRAWKGKSDDVQEKYMLACRWDGIAAIRRTFGPWRLLGLQRRARDEAARDAQGRIARAMLRRSAFQWLLSGLHMMAAENNAEASATRALVQRVPLRAAICAWQQAAAASLEPRKSAADRMGDRACAHRIIALWREALVISKRDRALEEHKKRMWAKVNSWIAEM